MIDNTNLAGRVTERLRDCVSMLERDYIAWTLPDYLKDKLFNFGYEAYRKKCQVE